MRLFSKSLAIIGLVFFGLSACQSKEESTAVPLNSEEVLAHISGNTEVWTKGGGYYSPDGSLIVKWDGKDGSGTWEVTEDGEVCYSVDVWGGSRDCHSYENDNGTISLVYEGNRRVAEIREGNQLDGI